MYRKNYSIFFFALVLMAPLGTLLVTGCSNNQASPEGEGAGGPRRGGGPGGGPGGRGGGFSPVDAKATAPEIFQMKCAGCHGDKGQGRMGPNLTKKAGAPDDALYKVIHDGAGKMPAFGNQMTEAQIKELVTYVKGLGKA